MPGIAGELNFRNCSKKNVAENMADRMMHEDFYRKEGAACESFQMGSAILQQTGNGIYEDEKIILAFYGEVFEIRGYQPLSDFPLQSSQEVYRYLAQYGFDVIKEFNGAFALAYYEKDSKRLRLAVDRMSIHRIFYWEGKDVFAFASEAKALYCAEGFIAEPDYVGIQELLTFRHTFGGRTFWKGVRLLPPGSILTVENEKVTIERYWNIKLHCNRRKVKSNDAYVDELYSILKKAVEIRTPSEDVAMGLSGGCDARTILNLLPKQGSDIHSFTYGTEQCGDVICAMQLAELFGTDEMCVEFTKKDVERDVKRVVWLTDGAAEADLFFHVKMTRLKREKAKFEVSSVPGDAVSGKLNAQTQLLMMGERSFSTPGKREKIYKKMYQRMLLGKPSIYDSELFSEEFVSKYANAVQKDIHDSFITDCDAEKLTDIMLQSLLFQSTTGRTLPVMGGMPSVAMTVRFPFLDYNVLDFFCRLPSGLWCGQKTYLRMINRCLTKSASIPHYVTGKPISENDNMRYLYLKVKDYVLRKFKIRQQHVFGSDTYDFKREILVNEAKEYVLDTICAPHVITDRAFDKLSREQILSLMEDARNGDEKAFHKINSRFTASVLSELFFDTV